jgi:hypothetical protein
MHVRLLWVLPLPFLAACADEDAKGRTPLAGGALPAAGATAAPPAGPPPGMTVKSAALLDSGNVAFRTKQYPLAQQYYEKAAAEVPDQAAPWYGVYMVAQAIKNQTLADSALKMVRTRSGGSDLMGSPMGKAHEGVKQP